MATVTISITTEAHGRLKRLKGPGDTFSDVLIRELPDPCDTAGTVLDHLEQHGVPKANPRLEAAMLSGRGRRARRKL